MRNRSPALLLVLVAACTPFAPEGHDQAPFRLRVEVQQDDAFRVATAALSRDEARRFLGLDLLGDGIQPVWIEIENRTARPAWFLPIGTDPAYFAPYEVAYGFHRPFASARNRRIDDHLLATAMPLAVPAGGRAAGYVHTHAGEGARYLRVQVLDADRIREYRFVAEVPGGKWDFQRVDFDRLYPAAEVRDLDLPALLAELERLPCCAADEHGAPLADPLNLVVVGGARERR